MSLLTSFLAFLIVPLLGAQTYPESLSYRPSTGVLYVSGSGDGSVQAVPTNGPALYFLPPGADGRTEAYGVKVDDGRDRLWLVDGKTVFVYALSTRVLLGRIDRQSLGAVADSFLNDIALDGDGNAYVTDSRDPNLVFVRGTDFRPELRALRGIPYGDQNKNRYNLNGVVLSPDGRSLLSVKTNDGTLWKIPLAGGDAVEIPLAIPVTDGDGLAWAPGGRLVVFRNFEDRVSAIDVGSAAAAKPVAELPIPGLSTPTAGAFLSDGRLAVVNSQFAHDAPELPFALSLVGAPL